MSNEEQEANETPQEAPKQGYGSKWKRMVLIYLVVGAVVYAIIYFVFLNGPGGGGFNY